jgi:flagellar hook assembly protein FlgD
VPVDISIYDLRGRLIRTLVDEEKPPGTYQVHWNGRDDMGTKVPSGVYLYRITAGDFISTRKMVMMK